MKHKLSMSKNKGDTMDSSETKKTLVWNAYLLYLKDWIVGHLDSVHYGSAPVCFDEWLDNEGEECL